MRSTKIVEELVFPVASPAPLSGETPLRDWPDLARHILLHDSAANEAEPRLAWQV